MDPSTLSKIISGKRRLGASSLQNLLKKLEIEFNDLDNSYDSLSIQESETLCNWQDFVILEQINVTGFKANKAKLSSAIGLSIEEIELSISKLKRLDLIEIKKSGLISEKTSGQTTNITSSTNHVKKNLQKQFLEKAISSIDFDSFEKRDMTTITIAIDSKKFAEARERIKKFRREMAEFLGNGKTKDQVFNMTIAFYPTSKNYKEK